MNSQSQRMPWRRLLLEGSVIVFSILLAFAIDAWWDDRKEHTKQLERLVRVAAELQLNSENIQSIIEILEDAIDATSEYLVWMGPQPQEVQLQSFHSQWVKMISIGTFSLVRRAAEDYLAAGNITSSGDADIRNLLSEWYSYGDKLEKQFEILRVEHAKLVDYTNTKTTVPGLHTISTVGVMQRHPKSKFPYDQSELLSDPMVETLLATYLIRLEFVIRLAAEHQERQSNLLISISSIASE